MNPVNDVYLKLKNDPFKIFKEPSPVLDGGKNPVPLLYNNEGQYNPVPRINQPAPVEASVPNQQPQENPIKRFFNSLRTPEGYVRQEGQGLSSNNPFMQYYGSKWWKPTVATQLKAQEWETQNQARQAQQAAMNAKGAEYFTIDRQFIDNLNPNDPLRPYLKPGMQISTDTLYRFAGLNQKQSTLDADEITDEERQTLVDRYNKEIDVHNPDGTINPDKYNLRQSIMSAIYDFTSKKELQRQLAKLNALQVPKALPQVKADNIAANTERTQAQTETEKVRPALIEAQTANTQANAEYTQNIKPQLAGATIANRNASTKKKLSGGSGSGSGGGGTKADKDFMARIDKDYSQYMGQLKAKGMGAISKTKDQWLKQEYPEKYERYYKLQHGGLSPETTKIKGPIYLPGKGFARNNWDDAQKISNQYGGPGEALKSLMKANPKNINNPLFRALVERYNQNAKTKYTPKQFYDKFVK